MGVYHTIARGECLSSIAKQYGFSDYQIIYNHAENAGFKQKRSNPNIIFPGDVLFIPDKEIKEVSCATDKKHKFQAKVPKVMLRICLEDDLQQPYVNTKYRLVVGSDTYEGTTDGSGILEQEIQPDATEGEVTIWPGPPDPADPGISFPLSLGDLDPVEELSGVQARLENLGFDCGSGEDASSPEMVEALKGFQTKFGLTVSGEIDDATRNKLRELHDAE